MSTSVLKWIPVALLAAFGVSFAAAGFYVAQTDDAPGVALIGLILMMVSLTFAIKLARKR